MKKILIEENTQQALAKISEANEPICVELSLGSCFNGAVFDLLAVAGALKKHGYATVAIVHGVATAIALTGAEKVEMDDNAMILITPLKTHAIGGVEEQKKAMDTLEKASGAVSEALARWPEMQSIFDAGEERFISKSEAVAMGVI